MNNAQNVTVCALAFAHA